MTPARRWTVVLLLSLGMIISYIDRGNLSVALSVKEFKDLFHLTDNDRGALSSAFFWSYAFLQIPIGFVIDRYGVKKPYAIGFAFWSVMSAATGLANSFSQLYIV